MCLWTLRVATGADSIGHGRNVPPLLQMLGTGAPTVSRRNSKQETDQTVLTIT